MSHEKAIEKAIKMSGLDGVSHIESRLVVAIKAYLDASGMVMVPREPTEDMIESTGDIVTHTYGGDYNGYMDGYVARAAYECMLSKAPNPFQTPKESREKK